MAKNSKENDLASKILNEEKKLTGNMIEDMETRDKIHKLQMELTGVEPQDSYIECIGCGS